MNCKSATNPQGIGSRLGTNKSRRELPGRTVSVDVCFGADGWGLGRFTNRADYPPGLSPDLLLFYGVSLSAWHFVNGALTQRTESAWVRGTVISLEMGTLNPAHLLEAIAFAAEKHRQQRRRDSEESPYINHSIAVAAVLAGFCYTLCPGARQGHRGGAGEQRSPCGVREGREWLPARPPSNFQGC
jgi:hypothetical protein